ncbi:MAG: hypothetical protein KDC38_05230, partial [Planctomycetes bacterium]|nr:hypothetical protein [Planctomycetota bacterium]
MTMIVHVIGTGTIGEPLIGLLTHFREQLGVDEVTFNKRTPLLGDRSKVVDLMKRGALLATGADRRREFEEMGMKPTFETEEAIERATVVIDCTPSGAGLENKKKHYDLAKSVKGFIAQGSEFGFGKMYARGINDAALIPGEDHFIQVVSCNTHNLAALITTFALDDGGPENLSSADFVCIRRANDVSQEGSFLPSPQVGKHGDAHFGTHHARDASHLFATLGYDFQNLFSSACKVNSQYMHLVRFHIRVEKPTDTETLLKRIEANDRLALTYKRSANEVFSFGRDHGFFGRILNQTVIPRDSLRVVDGHDVYGFCFTPQDGNSLLSSVAAALWLREPATYEDKLQCLTPYFFD